MAFLPEIMGIPLSQLRFSTLQGDISLGLNPTLAASISPPTVDVIIQGPLPILETLTPASFRVVVDLTGLSSGVHQVTPVVDLVPDQVTVQAILPNMAEVVIFPITNGTPTPGATATPVALPTP